MSPPVLGLASGAVTLSPYDARWPVLYVEEQARILAALGTLPAVIDHIGGARRVRPPRRAGHPRA